MQSPLARSAGLFAAAAAAIVLSTWAAAEAALAAEGAVGVVAAAAAWAAGGLACMVLAARTGWPGRERVVALSAWSGVAAVAAGLLAACSWLLAAPEFAVIWAPAVAVAVASVHLLLGSAAVAASVKALWDEASESSWNLPSVEDFAGLDAEVGEVLDRLGVSDPRRRRLIANMHWLPEGARRGLVAELALGGSWPAPRHALWLCGFAGRGCASAYLRARLAARPRRQALIWQQLMACLAADRHPDGWFWVDEEIAAIEGAVNATVEDWRSRAVSLEDRVLALAAAVFEFAAEQAPENGGAAAEGAA